MKFTIASRPSSATKANEDVAFVSERAIVLLDGAGGPSEIRSGCKHGVLWYVHELGSRLIRQASLDSSSSLGDALRTCIVEVALLHSSTCQLDEPGTPSSTVTALRVSDIAVEYLVLADTSLVFQLGSGMNVVCDDRVRTAEKASMNVYGDTLPGTRERDELRKSFMQQFQRWRNTEGGYWVAAENPKAVDYAIAGAVDLRDVNALVVMSDGAAALVTNYQQLTWAETFAHLSSPNGANSYLDLLRAVESSDATCKRWPRTKIHDDATLVLCQLEKDA